MLRKLYYVAQMLPLPNKQKKRIEQSLSRFIFRGRHERLQLSVLENKYEAGGLGLVNIAVKADSLLVKQMCRMMSMPGENSFRVLGYWVGGYLNKTVWGDFPMLAEAGPVSHSSSKKYPLHQYMLDNFMESLGRGEVDKDNLKNVTTRGIYTPRRQSSCLSLVTMWSW